MISLAPNLLFGHGPKWLSQPEPALVKMMTRANFNFSAPPPPSFQNQPNQLKENNRKYQMETQFVVTMAYIKINKPTFILIYCIITSSKSEELAFYFFQYIASAGLDEF